MKPFRFERARTTSAALQGMAHGGGRYLAGGTNLLDLMKHGVEQPDAVVHIGNLGLTQVTQDAEGRVMIGALVRNSDLADHALVREHYPLLAQALLSGASPQLRNMATVGGNLMQRTRCPYFMDTVFPACNKRVPGSGCAAIDGFNRMHAVLGQTDRGAANGTTCIATNPSDMNVALAALDATIHVEGLEGRRAIPIAMLHRLPGDTPHLDTTLAADELITAVSLPAPRFAAHSSYVKVRDRASYAFALVSVAAGLAMRGTTIAAAGLALGGVAHKPWRSVAAERSLEGVEASAAAFERAAEIALEGAEGYRDNAFKIALAKRVIVRALTQAQRGGATV